MFSYLFDVKIILKILRLRKSFFFVVVVSSRTGCTASNTEMKARTILSVALQDLSSSKWPGESEKVSIFIVA